MDSIICGLRKIPLYWKYLLKRLWDDDQNFNESVLGIPYSVVFLAIWFYLATRSFVYAHEWAQECAVLVGLVLLLGLVIHLGTVVWCLGRENFHDLQFRIRKWRRKRWDRAKYYAMGTKTHVPLPPAVVIPIALIQDAPLMDHLQPPTEEQAEEMARSIRMAGLLRPIKLRPLRPEEKDLYPGQDYRLVTGRRRLAGAKRLGWEKIKAHVLDLEKGYDIAEWLCDNDGPFRPWVEAYGQVWDLLVTKPGVALSMVGTINFYSKKELETILDLMDVLTPKARERIARAEARNEEPYEELHGYMVEKRMAWPLARLSGLCHDPLLARELADGAVDALFKWRLEDVEEIKALVDWVVQGWWPEDFVPESARSEEPPVPAPPPTRTWKDRDSREPDWKPSQQAPSVLTPPDPAFTQPPPHEVGPLGGAKWTQGQIPLENIGTLPYHQGVLQEGGLRSYVKFMHRCLRRKGLGASPSTRYQWGARAMMAWIDFTRPSQFPLFDPGPGRIEEPVYVFYVTEVGKTPIQWVAAAEVVDIQKGCHLEYGGYWTEEYLRCVQVGLLDRLKNPVGAWAGGICGTMGVVKYETVE